MNEPAAPSTGTGRAIAVSDDSLAALTLRRVREALTHRDSACVTQVLNIVQEMSQKADELSVQDLAGIIGRDLTTVTKVMNAAHCLGYNPGAVEIRTLPEAIATIGFEKIRNLVLSLLLMETAETRTGERDCCEVAAHSLASGLVAQSVMAAGGMEPDQVFVCAALRHYGTLLLCTFLPEEYRRARQLEATAGTSGAAFRSVFGLTPLEIGQRILNEAGLAKTILLTLQPVSQNLLRSNNPSETDRLQVVSDLASRICETIAKPGGVDQCRSELLKVVKGYARSVPLTEQELDELLESVGETLGTFGRAHGYEVFSSPLIQRIHCLAEGRVWSSDTLRRGETSSATDESAVKRGPDPLVVATAEIAQLLQASSPDYRKIFNVLARAVRAALRLRSCLIFLPDPASGMFAAEIGAGPLFDALRNQPVLNPQIRDVFSVSLGRGEDAVLKNPTDPKIAPFIPEWFKQSPGRGPLVLLPVGDDDGTFALICGVVHPGEPIELSGSRLQQLKILRTHLRPLGRAISPGRAA